MATKTATAADEFRVAIWDSRGQIAATLRFSTKEFRDEALKCLKDILALTVEVSALADAEMRDCMSE